MPNDQSPLVTCSTYVVCSPVSTCADAINLTVGGEALDITATTSSGSSASRIASNDVEKDDNKTASEAVVEEIDRWPTVRSETVGNDLNLTTIRGLLGKRWKTGSMIRIVFFSV